MMFFRLIASHLSIIESFLMADRSLSLAAPQHSNLKSTVKNWLGQMSLAASPARGISLYKNPEAHPKKAIDRVIMSHLRHRALTEGRTKFFERLHKNFWAGDGGAVFSSNCDHRFEDLFLENQREDLEALNALWDPEKYNAILEVGANSGLLLDYLTRNLTGVQSAIGIDINEPQVKKNQQSTDFDPRVKFGHADGQQYVIENGKPNTLFVTNGGVMEYFTRQRLDEMLQHIAGNCGPALFFCSEPVAEGHDLESMKESIPFGEELSFSHNYTDLFESNGFQVSHQRSVIFEQWKMLTTIASI